MDAAELVQLGTSIVEISGKLTAARKKRDEAQTEVTALETELAPLLLKHAQLIAGIAGQAMPAPVPSGPQLLTSSAPLNGAGNPMKDRVKEYLKRLPPDEPVSASDVAEHLHIDAIVVREAMLEMRNQR